MLESAVWKQSLVQQLPSVLLLCEVLCTHLRSITGFLIDDSRGTSQDIQMD
jgi:hypothetical protein